MAASNIQISDNSSNMRVFWEADTTGTYKGFKLYWATTSAFSTPNQIGGVLSNATDVTYSTKHVFYRFVRPVTDNTGFYMKLVGVFAGSGADDSSNPSAIKYIPALNEDVPANNIAKLFAYDATAGIWRKVISVKDAGSEGGNIHTV